MEQGALPHIKPVQRLIAVLTVLYGLVWIPLEGALWSVLMMGGLATLWLLTAAYDRWGAGRTFSTVGIISLVTLTTAAAALFWVLLSLAFMAVKTGLHAHGPEFSPAEISWLWSRLPGWTGIGGLAGLGFGLIAAGISPRRTV